jgi:hypothetical protein
MSTLFAFLHHLCAFTLVSAVAVEFTLIRQELTLAIARRLQITDLVLGIAAGALLVIGLLRVFFFEKRGLLFPQSRLSRQALDLCRDRAVVDYSDPRIPVVEQAAQGRAGARTRRQKAETGHRGHSRRACRHRHHPALRRHHGAGRMGLDERFHDAGQLAR